MSLQRVGVSQRKCAVDDWRELAREKEPGGADQLALRAHV